MARRGRGCRRAVAVFMAGLLVLTGASALARPEVELELGGYYYALDLEGDWFTAFLNAGGRRPSHPVGTEAVGRRGDTGAENGVHFGIGAG